MAWLPEQTGAALEDIASDMRALIAKAERIERNAAPEWRDALRAGDFGQMTLHDFVTDALQIAEAIFADVEAKTREIA